MTRPKGGLNRPKTVATGVVWVPNRRKDRPTQTTVVTVPSGLRQSLRWEEGDELTLTATKGGALVVKKVDEATL